MLIWHFSLKQNWQIKDRSDWEWTANRSKERLGSWIFTSAGWAETKIQTLAWNSSTVLNRSHITLSDIIVERWQSCSTTKKNNLKTYNYEGYENNMCCCASFSLVKILSFKCIVVYLKPNAATFVKVECCTRKTLTTTITFFSNTHTNVSHQEKLLFQLITVSTHIVKILF